MKVTGHGIRLALRQWSAKRDALAVQFEASLYAFPGENRPSPADVMDRLYRAERAVASLQELQARYNVAVTVTVAGESITLCEAIKRTGGVGRMEKAWRKAAGLNKTTRYYSIRE